MRFAILSARPDPRAQALEHCLRAALARVSAGAAAPSVTNDPADAAGAEFVIWLHDGKQSTALAGVDTHVAEQRALVLVDDLANARGIPQPLDRLNAMAIGVPGHEDFETAAQQALTTLLLHRRRRRVFLSYKRTDSEVIANELHDRLLRRRYETFLDTVAVDFGADVQREVRDELVDADAAIVLLSPNLTGSKWVLEEIALASAACVPLLVVAWPVSGFPGHKLPHELAAVPGPSSRLQLRDDQFDSESAWSKAVYETVIDQLEANRVRGVLERTRNLHGRVAIDLPAGFRTEHVPGTLLDLRVLDASDRPCGHLRALPFLPTADSAFEFAGAVRGTDAPATAAWLAFYEDDAGRRRTRALRWALDATRSEPPNEIRLVGHPHESLAKLLAGAGGGAP